MSITEKLEKLDKRIIYIVLFLVVALFSLYPMGLSVQIAQWNRDSYNTIEGLEPGDIVLMWSNVEPRRVEMKDAAIVAIKHLFSKEGIKMIFVQSRPLAPPLLESYIEMAKPESYGKEYGIDWINLGYIAGRETMAAALGSDLKGLVNLDKYGNQLETLQLWNEVSGISDVKLIVAATNGGCVDYLARQLQTAYGTPIVFFGESDQLSSRMFYYTAGQFPGMTAGYNDIAGYEQLTGFIGKASKMTDVLSGSHIAVIIFMVLGNIGYLGKKLGGGGNLK